jgi:hypothetical protein
VWGGGALKKEKIYTGIKDIRGNKIYTGDTVRGVEETTEINFPNGWKGRVVLQRGAFMIPNRNNGGICIGELTLLEKVK